MSLAGLLPVIAEDPQLQHALSQGDTDADLIAPPALRPFAGRALAAARQRTPVVLAVTATGREAEDLAARCGRCCPPDAVAVLPGLGDAAARAALAARRHGRPAAGRAAPAGPPERRRPGRAARCGSWWSPGPRRCCSRRCPGSATWSRSRCAAGETPDLDRRRPTGWPQPATPAPTWSSKRGEFAVRGGILDVFPPTEEHPLRVEFWGDEVEEIRYFTVADQRSLRGRRARAVGAAVPRAAADRRRSGRGPRSCRASTPSWPSCSTRSADGNAVEGMEALAPVLVDELELVLHDHAAGAHVVLCDPERVRTRAADLVRTIRGVPRGVLGGAAAGGAGAGRPRRGLASGRSPTCGARPSDSGLPWWTSRRSTAGRTGRRGHRPVAMLG